MTQKSEYVRYIDLIHVRDAKRVPVLSDFTYGKIKNLQHTQKIRAQTAHLQHTKLNSCSCDEKMAQLSLIIPFSHIAHEEFPGSRNFVILLK